MSSAAPLPASTPPSSFRRTLDDHGLAPLTRGRVHTLQVNVGKRCNQACNHCHVEAGPKRTEMMDSTVAAEVLRVMKTSSTLTTVDITGGAPELNPHFRSLVDGAVTLGLEVIDRCNLTVLWVTGQEDLARPCTGTSTSFHGVRERRPR